MNVSPLSSTGRLPLDGMTVVSVEQAVAAPLATRNLADMGARVIKVERVDGGDFARNYDHAIGGVVGSHFVWLNRGKESVAVNLKHPSGRAVLDQLLDLCDVFIQNLAPGAAQRLGYSAESLRARRPEMIVVDMSGYGSVGPYADKKAYDMLVQAESGLISVTGTPEQPAKTGVPSADIGAGLYAFSAVLAALVRRERSGEGASIEICMFDSLVEWMGYQMYTAMYTDSPVGRMGLSHAAIAPYDAYPTTDGQVLIGVQNDRGWRALATEVLNCPELADNPDYETNVLRCQHRQSLDRDIAGLTSRLTTADLTEKLDAAHVPSARINDVHAMIDHPQLRARGRWREVGTPAGPARAVLPPITFTDVAAAMGPVPGLGEHTDSLLAELGYSQAQITQLHEVGTVA